MICEPIEFRQDDDGSYHFAHESMPFKTIIDVKSLVHMFAKVNSSRGTVEITLDGRHIVYERVATGLHGEWICVLRIGRRDDDAP